jgi:hypothetical protein
MGIRSQDKFIHLDDWEEITDPDRARWGKVFNLPPDATESLPRDRTKILAESSVTKNS